MALLQRIRVVSAGYPGGPGVTTFYCVDATTFMAPLRAHIAFMSNHYPPNVTYTFPLSGDTIDSFTGEIQDQWLAASVLPVTGTGVANYAAPVGYSVRWATSVFLSGRKLRGRSFYVPATNDIFDVDGSIKPGPLATIQESANALIASTGGNFSIWQRPRLARAADGSRKAVTARSGGNGVVSSATVPDKAAVLRSRRD